MRLQLLRRLYSATRILAAITLLLISSGLKSQGVSWDWATGLSGSGDYTITDSHFDQTFATYITGYYDDSGDENDQVFFFAKYNANGVQSFFYSFGDTGVVNKGTYPQAIVSDASNNIYVAGYYNTDSLAIGGLDTLLNPSGANRYDAMFIAKFDPVGTPVWSISSEGTLGERITDMTMDGDGNLIVVGHTIEPNFTFLGHTHSNTEAGQDGFLAKIDTDGNRIWSTVDDGNVGGIIEPRKLAVDANGDIYFTGQFKGTSVPMETGPIPSGAVSSQGGTFDFFITKYNADGTSQWLNVFGGSGGSELGTAITTDTSNNVYVAGTYGSSFSAGGLGTFDNRGGEDVFLIRYSTDGTGEWLQKIHGSSDESAKGLVVGSNNQLVISGGYSGQPLFWDSYPPNYTNGTYVTLYDLDGNVLGINGYDNGEPADLAVGNEKSVLLVGNMYAAMTFDDEQPFYASGQDGFLAYGILNFPPSTVNLSSTTVIENSIGEFVGKLSTIDPEEEDTHTYELGTVSTGADSALFTISNDSLFVNDTALNYEADNELQISIVSTDDKGATKLQQFTISVIDQNDAPTAIGIDKSQFIEGTDELARLSVTDEDVSDDHTYALVAGEGSTDNDAFEIKGDSLLPLEPYDFEVQDTLLVRVAVTDAGGLSFEKALVLTVYDARTTYAEVSNDVTFGEIPEEFDILDFDVDANGEILVLGSVDSPWELNDSTMNSGGWILRMSDSIAALQYGGINTNSSHYIVAGQAGDDNVFFSSLNDFQVRYNEDSTKGRALPVSFGFRAEEGLLDPFGNAWVVYENLLSGIKVIRHELTSDAIYIPDETVFSVGGSPVFSDIEVDGDGNVFLTYRDYNDGIIHLLKMDNGGNVIWDNTYTRSSGTGQVWIDNFWVYEDRIEAKGSTNSAGTIVDIGGTLIDATDFYFEVDTSGTTYYTVNNVEQLYDIRIGDRLYNVISENSQIIVQDFALDKSALTLQEYATLLEGTLVDFDATPDGNLVLYGTVTKQAAVSSTTTAWVAEVDLTGNVLHYKEIDENIYSRGEITTLWSNGLDRALLGGWTDETFTWDNQEVLAGYFVADIDANGVMIAAYSIDHMPSALAATSGNEVYYADADSLYKLDGSFNLLWSQFVDAGTDDLLVDSNDDVYVIQKETFSGKTLKFGADGTPDWTGNYNSLRDAGLLGDSLVVLESLVGTEKQLKIYDPDGALARSTSFDGYSDTDFIAIGPEGQVFAEKSNVQGGRSVLVYDRFLNQIDSLKSPKRGELKVNNSGQLYLSKNPFLDTDLVPLPPYQTEPDGDFWEFLGDQMLVAGDFYYNLLGENAAPEGFTLSNASVPENDAAAFVGKFTVQDSDDTEGWNYEVGRWRSQYDYFEYESGALNFVGFEVRNDSLFTYLPFDFEDTAVQLLEIKVTDSRNGTFTDQIQITITDANDSITDISINEEFINEALPAGTVLTGFEVTDIDENDTFSIELVAGEGDNLNPYFSIENNQLVASELTLDYDSVVANGGSTQGGAFYDSLRVRATDTGGLFMEKFFSIGVRDSNELATEIRLVTDNSNEGTALQSSLSTDDPENLNLGYEQDTYTYSLVDGEGSEDNTLFQINPWAPWELRLSEGTADFEADSSYLVRIRVDHDDSDHFLEQAFELKVTDVNTAPTAIGIYTDAAGLNHIGSIPEYLYEGDFIGFPVAIDQEDPEDDHIFTVNDPNFILRNDSVVVAVDLNLSSLSGGYTLSMYVDDQKGGTLTYDVVLNISNINDAPTNIFANSTGSGPMENEEFLLELQTVDQWPSDDTHTYSLVEGIGDSDNDRFEISADSLICIEPFNFEVQNTASFRVRTTDSYGESYEKALTINIADVNEAPYGVEIDNTTIPENSAQGTLIGTFSASDEDNHSISFHPSEETGVANDNSDFTFANGNQLLVNSLLDYETKSEYTIYVIPRDEQGLDGEGAYFTITVTDVDDGVELSATSIDENTQVGTVVGTLSSPAGSMTFELTAGEGGEDNGLFSISGDQLQVAGTINYEEKSELSILVTGTPTSGGQASTQQFTLVVNDLNEAPTSIALDGVSIAENEDAGTLVGLLTAEDEDADEQLTLSVMGTDFAIIDNQLISNRVFDYGVEQSVEVTITAEDKGGLTLSETFEIEIINDPSDDHLELGVADGLDELMIYPNPVKDLLSIELEKRMSGNLQVFDLTGMTLIHQKVDALKFDLDVSELAPGQYVVQFITAEGIRIARFVKVK